MNNSSWLPDTQALSPNVILLSKKIDFNTNVIFYDEINNFKEGRWSFEISQIAKMTGLVLDPYGIMRKKG